MAETKDKLRKAFRQKIKGKNGFMTEEKHEKAWDNIDKEYARRRAKGQSTESLALLEDLVDYDRYNSSRKREPVPYERQREMGVSTPRQPKGIYVDIEEASKRRRAYRKKK